MFSMTRSMCNSVAYQHLVKCEQNDRFDKLRRNFLMWSTVDVPLFPLHSLDWNALAHFLDELPNGLLQVSFVDHKWKDTPNCLITAYIAAHLILRYFVICICYSEDDHIATFVNIFTYVLHRLDGVTIFHIDVSLMSFGQYWRVWHRPTFVYIISLSYYLNNYRSPIVRN